MGILDRFLGGVGAQRPIEPRSDAGAADDQAIARYRYMLRTAPPETIEQAHAEAFARLTPEQRRRVLEQLRAELPEGERMALSRSGDDPAALARMATRAEVRQPGALERVFGGLGAAPGGTGFGGLVASSFLGSMAGTILGSMIAQNFFAHHPDASHLFGGATADAGTALDDRTAGLVHDPFQDRDGAFGGGDMESPGNFDSGGDFDAGGFDSGGGIDV